MDIFFQDPSEVPLPPDEVRIRELRAEPWPDGSRVHVYLEVDPFQKRPSAELSIRDVQGRELTSTSILETMVRKMELNVHIRPGPPPGDYILHATLFYSIPKEGEEQPAGPNEPLELPERETVVIDEREAAFTIGEGG